MQKEWKVRETEWYSSVLAQDPACRIVRLRRYIMELVALNVQADFRALNIALYRYNCWGHDNSILSPTERENLLDLGRYAQGLHDDYMLGKPINQLDLQRYHLEMRKSYAHLSPVGCWPVFESDLLAWYAEPATSEGVRVPWIESGVAESELIRAQDFTPWKTNEALMQGVIQGFDFLIRTFSLNDGVKLELTKALERSNRNKGFGQIEPKDDPILIRIEIGMLVKAILTQCADAVENNWAADCTGSGLTWY